MHLLITGGGPEERRRAASAHCAQAARTHTIVRLDAATLPFRRWSRIPGAGPHLIRVDDVEGGFPNTQTSGTRLILTQSTYTVQKWVDTLHADDLIVATCDLTLLEHTAPEALQQRGPWRLFDVRPVEPFSEDTHDTASPTGPESNTVATVSSVSSASAVESGLIRAYRELDALERVRLCRDAVTAGPRSEVAHLALGSALREIADLPGARGALDEALRLAPQWEAVHYEDGKFWLGCEDLERARDAFARACGLMPTFSAAWSNLGATLGELDDPNGALAAFERALASDPSSATILNNIGVVTRELGLLDRSEAALKRVVTLAPAFVFGHYNLGHSLFLAGKFTESLAAYEEGQRRDPHQNRRQGCRIALVRLATGDSDGAERDLWRFADQAQADEREDLLLEAYDVVKAISAGGPERPGMQRLLERIAAEIGAGP